jgi:Kdo2-lipid IVA lauroyltransferase/acyltransferase
LAQNKNSLQVRLEYAAAQALFGTLRALPLRAAYGTSYAAARVLDVALPKLRRVGHKNLSFAFPEFTREQRDEVIDGVFRSIGRMLVGLARFPSLHAGNIGQWISYEGLENYQAAKALGRGVLVATAHLGNWELSAFAHALMTEPMHVMVRPLDNPLVDTLVEQRRTLSGNHLIYKKDAARAVIKALRGNEAVGILIDQNTAPAEGVFVKFFGKPACANSAFVKLAYHSGAPVIPGFALWDETKRRYTLYFYPQVELSGEVKEDTQRIHSVLESVIRRHPDQWMWIHRRWKTRPEGESSLY